MGCGVKDEKFYYFRFFLGLHEKSVYRGELSEKTGLGQFADLRGGLCKKEMDSVFEEGAGLLLQCTLCISNLEHTV